MFIVCLPMGNVKIHATPVLIIGAGRSGTNMLRDLLSQIDVVDTWPCDEINYIWRYGNRNNSTDQFEVAQASPKIVKFIRERFALFVSKSKLINCDESDRIILEKTCANSLRVPFVEFVLPEARFIHLIRDGRDVVSSAEKRWKAPLDIGYILAKARYVPVRDIPYYAIKYFSNRIAKLGSSENSLKIWGPKFSNMDKLSQESTVAEICAHQWVSCVESSLDAFDAMDDSKCITLKYEDFVNAPVENMRIIFKFLNIKVNDNRLESLCSGVRVGSVGAGTSNQVLRDIMDTTLTKLGYI